MRAASEAADRVVVSIFVNPTQFAPTEDFAAYPRDEASDLAMLAALGVDAVFAPTVAEMYPDGYATRITVEGPARGLESDARPHFFGGVATVVAKLFIASAPDIAMFGEKDYQQLLVVRRMAADLGLPVTVIGYPTVRAEDGLALSSRNAYLSPAERATAPRLHAALQAAAAAIRAGSPAADALAAARTRSRCRRLRRRLCRAPQRRYPRRGRRPGRRAAPPARRRPPRHGPASSTTSRSPTRRRRHRPGAPHRRAIDRGAVGRPMAGEDRRGGRQAISSTSFSRMASSKRDA